MNAPCKDEEGQEISDGSVLLPGLPLAEFGGYKSCVGCVWELLRVSWTFSEDPCSQNCFHSNTRIVVQSLSCPTPYDPMDCSTPAFPVLQFAQAHVHYFSDAIQPSHSLLTPTKMVFAFSTLILSVVNSGILQRLFVL